jgi:hypothetical protein
MLSHFVRPMTTAGMSATDLITVPCAIAVQSQLVGAILEFSFSSMVSECETFLCVFPDFRTAPPQFEAGHLVPSGDLAIGDV